MLTESKIILGRITNNPGKVSSSGAKSEVKSIPKRVIRGLDDMV